MSGIKGAEVSGIKGVEVSGINGAEVSGIKGSEVSGINGAEMSGIKGAEVPELFDTSGELAEFLPIQLEMLVEMLVGTLARERCL